MATAGGFAFAAAVRVVNRIHYNAANFRSSSYPACSSGFSQTDVFVFDISDLSDGCRADNRNFANFARRHTHLRVIAFFGDELGKNTG